MAEPYLIMEEDEMDYVGGFFPRSSFLRRSHFKGRNRRHRNAQESRYDEDLLEALKNLHDLRKDQSRGNQENEFLLFWKIGKKIIDFFDGNSPPKEILQRITVELSLSEEELQNYLRFASTFTKLSSVLSWEHYLLLLNITDKKEREFYHVRAVINKWSVSELNQNLMNDLYSNSEIGKEISDASLFWDPVRHSG